MTVCPICNGSQLMCIAHPRASVGHDGCDEGSGPCVCVAIPNVEGFACPRCLDQGWVCEDHPTKPFQHDDCGGVGWGCLCNPERVMRWKTIFATTDPERDEEQGGTQ
jgi:hypothetical protein